jgi:Fuc2NAc and GlcNAc transferase
LRLAKSWKILDRPNERSSHREPTPHGGGVPLLIAFAFGFTLMGPWVFELSWLFFAAIFLMLVGVLDDSRGLSVAVRFLAYTVVSISTAAVVLNLPSSSITPWVLLQWLCLSFAIIWALNLYNFMDGIDGIAATQCVLASLGAAFFANTHSEAAAYTLFCLLLAASALGFLAWNWAPARLFLGDAGSIPLGFLLAGLAGFGATQGFVSFAVWAVLLAAFIGDASWTLTARLLAGKRISQAHNQHGYQRLSRHWGSHQPVVLLLLALYVFWLFPIAWFLHTNPDKAAYLVILAYIPIALGMAKTAKLT